jgi:hypothetical protein
MFLLKADDLVAIVGLFDESYVSLGCSLCLALIMCTVTYFKKLRNFACFIIFNIPTLL